MATVRVEPIQKVQAAIIEAATVFEERMAARMAEFAEIMNSNARLLRTERRQDMEIRM
jgi:hypothetical protein